MFFFLNDWVFIKENLYYAEILLILLLLTGNTIKIYKEEIMARIKFLDILEETKSKPIYTESIPDPKIESSYRNTNSSEASTTEFLRKRERVSLMDTQDKLSDLRERSLLRDTGVSQSGSTATLERRSITENSVKKSDFSSALGIDDNKILLTGALFVLFGGMLFLSGYWVGKTITNNMRAEREMLMAQSMNNIKKDTVPAGLPALPTTMPPVTSTVDTIPTKQPVEVVEPATVQPVKKAKPVQKPVATKEYIIQISAHSTMESARAIEDQLRTAGFSAYTSESTIGDNVFFRVRVRGFASKSAAQETLSQIKSKNLGQDGFVLTLD